MELVFFGVKLNQQTPIGGILGKTLGPTYSTGVRSHSWISCIPGIPGIPSVKSTIGWSFGKAPAPLCMYICCVLYSLYVYCIHYKYTCSALLNYIVYTYYVCKIMYIHITCWYIVFKLNTYNTHIYIYAYTCRWHNMYIYIYIHSYV